MRNSMKMAVLMGVLLAFSACQESEPITQPNFPELALMSGPPELFTSVERALTDNERRMLAQVEEEPTTRSVLVVQLSDDALHLLQEQKSFRIPFSEPTYFTVTGEPKTNESREAFSWYGHFDGSTGYLSFVFDNGRVTGMIYMSNENYSIRPMGDGGLHVIIRLDPRGFGDNPEPLSISPMLDGEPRFS